MLLTTKKQMTARFFTKQKNRPPALNPVIKRNHIPCSNSIFNSAKEFIQLENAYLPFNRNGVMFPRRIGGNYMMLSRPSDNGHTPFGDIYISQSPDMTYWGKHRHVMSPEMPWESTKIGAGPIPIETDKGWLMFYHGVLTSCNGFVYSFTAALLDIDEPWKVLKRGREYLISPQEDYECMGDVPNVCFPCANLVDSETGRIAIYYGLADTHTGICFTTVDMVMDFLDLSHINDFA